MFFATIILCVSSQQLDIVKEQLFTDWTTSSRIANVTLGLPNENEINSVAEFVEQLRCDVTLATAGSLPPSQREIDVPFLMAMIDGITMEYSKGYAKKCLEHLDKLDAELGGIAASRALRMRHRAAVILGEEEEASTVRVEFFSLLHPHPEDAVVFTLFDIQQLFDRGDIESARELYDQKSNQLTSKANNYLRIPFAHGYARIAPTQREAIHGWCSIAEWLVEYGYDQSVVDAQLVRWFSRLQSPLVIETSSDLPQIASLALRLEISQSLVDNATVALEKLMELARAGDGRAAERVLEQGDSIYSEEAIRLLFQFPERVRQSLEYWQLYAAELDVRNRNFKDAIERLTPISKGNSEHQLQARGLLDTISSFEMRNVADAFDIDSYAAIPTKLHEEYEPCVIQDLLQQCISLCQTEGLTRWNKSALGVLLQNVEEISPGVLAEGYRLNGQCDKAILLFQEAIQLDGPSVQTTAGLADCTSDREAMHRVLQSTSPDDASSYWYWLSNVRLLQWFIEEGGDKIIATAKINRLRKKDASLGGAQFMSQFNDVAN